MFFISTSLTCSAGKTEHLNNLIIFKTISFSGYLHEVDQRADRKHVADLGVTLRRVFLAEDLRRGIARSSALVIEVGDLIDAGGQTEIDQIDLFALLVQEDQVGRLDIAVHNPLRMKKLDRLNDLSDDELDLGLGELLHLIDVLAERRAFEQHHDEVTVSLILEGLVQLQDATVVPNALQYIKLELDRFLLGSKKSNFNSAVKYVPDDAPA